MKYYKRPLLALAALTFLMVSCVPARQFEEMKAKAAQHEQENRDLKARFKTIDTELNECQAEVERLEKRKKTIEKDLDVCETSLGAMILKYDKLNEINNELLRKLEMLQAGNESENQKLSSELQMLQLTLQRKEDELRRLERELEDKKKNLDQLSSDLVAREKRVKELEALIEQKDAKVRSLQEKVKNALTAFQGKGLEIEMKNGKIYVKMEARLLFASGSAKVGSEGKKALIKLSKVLESQTDIEIVVEGHTDTDKIRSSSYPRDNWDLSVLRATSVVNIMLDNSTISPQTISAAGKSEFVPVDPADKSKNRRIEVVLIPSLDELYQMLDNNP